MTTVLNTIYGLLLWETKSNCGESEDSDRSLRCEYDRVNLPSHPHENGISPDQLKVESLKHRGANDLRAFCSGSRMDVPRSHTLKLTRALASGDLRKTNLGIVIPDRSEQPAFLMGSCVESPSGCAAKTNLDASQSQVEPGAVNLEGILQDLSAALIAERDGQSRWGVLSSAKMGDHQLLIEAEDIENAGTER